MSFDILANGDSKALLDLLVQVGVLLSFSVTFIGFIVRYFNKKLDSKIDARIDKVDDTLKNHNQKIESILLNKEQIDTERYMNLKEQVGKIDRDTDEIDHKLETHLLEASKFIGSTNIRLSNIEQKTQSDGSKS